MFGARLRRATSALAVLAGAAFLCAGGAAPSTAATLPDVAVPSATTVTVSITTVSPQVLRPGQDLLVRATLQNESTETIADPRATVRLSRTSMATRGALEAWATADPSRSTGTSLRTVALGAPLAPGAVAPVEITVPAASLGLSTSPQMWGARGLAVVATDGATVTGVARTFALWLPTDAPALAARTSISVLVPVVGLAADLAQTPPSPAGTPSATPSGGATSPSSPTPSTSAGGTASSGSSTSGDAQAGRVSTTFDPGGRLSTVLALTADRPTVSWAVDPALVNLAAQGGATAQTWLTRLGAGASGRDLFALPYADPDLAAVAHAGADTALHQAVSLTGTQPWVTSHAARTGLFLLPSGASDQSTLALAGRLGASAVVVDPDSLTPTDRTYTPTGRTTVSTRSSSVTALVPDRTLSDLLQNSGDASAAVAAQRVLAETAVIAREHPGESRRLLATVGRDWTPDLGVATAQLDALSSAPWVAVAPVSGLISAADPKVARTGLPADVRAQEEVSAADLAALQSAQDALTAFSTVLADPTALLNGVAEDILAPLSVAWRADAAGRTALITATIAELTARRDGLSIVAGSNVTLIAKSSEVPISVRNDLNQDAKVIIRLRPRNSCLTVPSNPTVTVPANETISVRVPFSAVATCDVVVDVNVVAPDGSAVATATKFTVRVRADWENLGTAVIAGLLFVGLVFGLWRTVRRGQTARRGARMLVDDNPEEQP